MSLKFYDKYHKKNKNVQLKFISDRNYTYQSLIFLSTRFIKPKSKILDLGCGVGTMSMWLASKGNDVVGLDVSQSAVNLANLSKKALNLKSVSFISGDVLKTSFKKSRFDAVVCSEVIEHIKDDRRLLIKSYSLLKKNGVLLLSTPLESAPLNRWGFLKKFDDQVGHLRRYSEDRLVSLVKKTGYEVLFIYKTEGVLRNILYTNSTAGSLVRFVRWPITIPINLLDKFLIKLFGASNIYIIARKP